MKLEQLTEGEILLVWRKRHALNQHEAARQYGVSVGSYAKMERDIVSFTPRKSPLLLLDDHERCMILRRRLGKTQKEVARDMGLSRLWVHKMETGQADCAQLLAHLGA